jgi:hypothetical protein
MWSEALRRRDARDMVLKRTPRLVEAFPPSNILKARRLTTYSFVLGKLRDEVPSLTNAACESETPM